MFHSWLRTQQSCLKAPVRQSGPQVSISRSSAQSERHWLVASKIHYTFTALQLLRNRQILTFRLPVYPGMLPMSILWKYQVVMPS